MVDKLSKAIMFAWNSPTITSWFRLLSLSLRGLIVTPLILTSMSTNMISIFYLFNTIAGVIPNITSAFSATYVRIFSYAAVGKKNYGEDQNLKEHTLSDQLTDREYFKKLYGCSNIIQFVLTIVILSFLSIAGYVGLKKQVSNVEQPHLVWIAWGIMIVAIATKAWVDRDAAILKGIGKIVTLNRWESLVGILVILSTAGLLALKFNVYAISISTALMTVLAFCYLNLIYRRVGKDYKRTRSIQYDSDIGKRVCSPAIREMTISIASTGVNHGAGIIAAYYIIGDDLASYLNAIGMMLIAVSVSMAPYYAHTPRFTRYRAQGDEETLAVETAKGIRNALLVFSLAVLALGCGLPIFYDLIGAKIDFIDNKIWIFMSLTYFLMRHEGMQAQVIMTTGKVPFVTQQIITGVIKIILMIVGIKYFGIIGGVGAIFVSHVLILNWYIPTLSWKTFSDFGKRQRKHYLPSFIGMLLLLPLGLYYLPSFTWWIYELILNK